MLFNSYGFLLVFLPIAFCGYVAASRGPAVISVIWLVLSSLTFYGIWNPAFVLLLIGSIVFNYVAGRFIGSTEGTGKRVVFVAAITVNLSLLFFFKYLEPLVSFAAQYGVVKSPAWLHIILPLGISFFTFTQIGYLVDRRDGLASDLGPLRYALFVTFFPHLIAGPILHVREVGPQLLDATAFKPALTKIAPGLALLAFGLTKKVLIADPLAATVSLGFANADRLGAVNAWGTALAYSMQLYFDFSGYSDMAIGLASIFGVRFPVNFNSPYKSRGVIEYWQRWHITLSRYLQLLLFSPIALALTRRRVARGLKVNRSALKTPSAFLTLLVAPTMITMTLAGIWHGAGLQFLVFGVLHAIYLCVNHAAKVFGTPNKSATTTTFDNLWRVILTYLAVLVAAVFFRAQSCEEALHLLYCMIGGHGGGLPMDKVAALHLMSFAPQLTEPAPFGIITNELLERLLFCAAVVWCMPNTQEILGSWSPTLEKFTTRWKALAWQPTYPWALATGFLLWASIMNFNQSTTFLYFQF